MRGFGTGVLFAAVILGISCLMRTSDTAVIRKARQLGMTYADSDEKLFEDGKHRKQRQVLHRRRRLPVHRRRRGLQARSRKLYRQPQSRRQQLKQNKRQPRQHPNRIKVFLKTEATDEEFKKEKDKIKKDFDKSTKEFTIHARRVVLSCESEAGESWSGIGCEKV